MGRMQAIGFHWTYLKQYRTVDDDLQAIDAVTAGTIRQLLDEHRLDQVTVVALGPLERMDNG
jgi:predicted Zn-dependent peptidase